MGTTFVNFPGLSAVEQQFRSAHSSITTAIEQMATDMKNATVEWEGDDKEQYETALGQWRALAEEMSNDLNGLSGNLAFANETYQQTVRTSAGNWA